MLQIPINSSEFKRDFLDGAGELDITGTSFDPAAPLPKTVGQLTTTSVSANPSLEFGKQGDLTCKVNFQGQAQSGIELLWPGDQNDFTKQHAIPAVPQGKVGAHLSLSASAGGNVAGTMPVGPAASFQFGIKAGAGVGYDRYCVYNDQTTAGDLLTDLVTGLRLPQGCDAVSRIPLPGEVLCLDYNGFLDLSAALNWGYQLTGSHDIDFNNLSAAVNYALRLKAGVNVGYNLGGQFSLESRAGHAPNWARVTVRKQRNTEFDFAASFNADASINLTGMPSSADDFLKALLGADATTALNLFEKIKGYTNLSQVEQEAGNLLNGSLQNLANKWLGKALDQSTVAEFLAAAGKVASDYENADQTVVNAVSHLYQDYLGAGTLDTLKGALQKIAGLSSRDGLTNLSDADSWQVINTLVGGDLFQLLQQNSVFAQITGTAQKGLDFLNGSWQTGLKDVIDELQSAFPLDKVFGQVAQYASKDKLLTLADQKLQGVVEKLLGTAWSKINSSNVGKLAGQLNDVLTKVENFKNTWYQRIVQAANQSFGLQANYTYTRATADDALIDVDIDLSAQNGPALFDAAAHGRFKQVFAVPNSSALQVYQGALTHQLTRSLQLQINVLGWEFTSFQQVVSNTEIAIQTGPSGQIQVFTTEASIEQRQQKVGRDKSTETVQSNFLLKFVGEATLPTSSPDLPYLIGSIDSMGAEYDLSYSDDKTSPYEMLNYLQLAESVGLVSSANDFLNRLNTEFPQGLGKVTAQYVVTFDSDGIRDAFTAAPGTASDIAHTVTQNLIRAQVVHRSLLDKPALIVLAALDPGVRQTYQTEGYTALEHAYLTVDVPPALGGGQENLDQSLNLFVISVLDMEYGFAKSFAALDNLVAAAKRGTPIPVNTLQKLATQFVESVANIADYGRINTMFAVFDALVQAGGNGKNYRESSMILTIQAGDAQQKITKYLSSAPARTAAVVAAPATA